MSNGNSVDDLVFEMNLEIEHDLRNYLRNTLKLYYVQAGFNENITESFWGTAEEIEKRVGNCNNYFWLFPHIEYYKKIFGKSNVIHYVDSSSYIDSFRVIESGEELEFDYQKSLGKNKYIWEKSENPVGTQSQLNEIANRLSLTL